MGVVALIISCIILFLQIHKNKHNDKVINPITFFLILWTFILLLSCFNLYKIHKPSCESYLLIVLMEIFFYFGSLISNKIFSKKNTKFNKKYFDHLKSKKLNYFFFNFLSFLIITFNIIDLTVVLKYYFSGIPMWQIRNWALSPFGSLNPILSRRSLFEEVLRTIIINPSVIVIYPISTYFLFNENNKRRKIMFMIISIIILITGVLANGGGRLSFIYYLLCLLLSFLTKYSKLKGKNANSLKELLIKYKKIILSFIFFAVFFITLFTVIRTSPSKIFKQFYTYFAMSPTLLSEWLPTLKQSSHTYGFLTFFGFYSYIFRFFKMIGLSFLVPKVFDNSYYYMLQAETFIYIGSGKSNAFVSPIYYFYLDGGYIYTVLASCFFGFIISKFYYNFKKSINLKSFIIYSLIMYAIFISFMRIQTVIPGYILSFIITYLLFNDKINNYLNEFKLIINKVVKNNGKK